MIIKSLIAASIIFNMIGFDGLSEKFDNAVIKTENNPENYVEASSEDLPLPLIAKRPKVVFGAEKPNAYAYRYVLGDYDTGAILAKENYKLQVPIASTTKIMTAVVVLENYKLDEVVTISSTAANQIGADANLMVGEEITVFNLLKCLLIKSGNDSAYALAEHMNTSGESGTAKFVEAMNKKARELNMQDTDYRDPAGLDVTGYSSAYDLFLVTKHALQNETFALIVKMPEAVAKDVTGSIYHDFKNSNRLVGEWDYLGAIGVKTGYMPEAGHCLVGAAKRDGHTLIAVVLYTHADTATASAEESRRLLDWGWRSVVWE